LRRLCVLAVSVALCAWEMRSTANCL